jgi:hypothetical protein
VALSVSRRTMRFSRASVASRVGAFFEARVGAKGEME